MARNVMTLRGRRLAEVMIPSHEVVAVSATSSTEAAQEVARKRGITRMPLFDRHRHDWLGIVDIFDLWPRDDQTTSLRERCRDVPRLPPHLSVEIAIGRIRRSRQPMAFVVQGGRCLGLVTLKDLVEEIVGDLPDL
jgi:CBS domain containing-hemolysin-like protein